MGGAHYFVLRQEGGRIFVTSLHFTTKMPPMFTLSQPTTGYCTPTHLPSTSLIQFSVCVSQACVASHKWTRGSVLTFQEKDSNRPYAISHVTNVKTNSGRKSRYFAAIFELQK